MPRLETSSPSGRPADAPSETDRTQSKLWTLFIVVQPRPVGGPVVIMNSYVCVKTCPPVHVSPPPSGRGTCGRGLLWMCEYVHVYRKSCMEHLISNCTVILCSCSFRYASCPYGFSASTVSFGGVDEQDLCTDGVNIDE